MTIIQNITDASPQNLNIVLPDGSIVTWTLWYRPNQSGWFYNISWDGISPPWVRNGNRLATSPNILRQARALIPFGITISTLDNQEPVGQEDFVSGYATAILLNAIDVGDMETTYFPGFP